MKILHPNKDTYLSLDKLNDYYKDGYYKIIATNEEEKLAYFLKCFEDYRAKNNEKITDTTLFENLPFSINTKSWKAKQKDIKIIDKLIGEKDNLKILDVGCWNGWLCNYLTKKGHQATGLDVFTDQFDGLGAKKHYANDFTLLQMYSENIHRIKDQFDVIIFNWNWAYLTDQQDVLNKAKKLLSNNGIIVFLGLTFYNNPKIIITHLNKTTLHFQEKYGIPLFQNNTKGYLDKTEISFFKKNNIKLKSEFPLKIFLKKLFLKPFINQYAYYLNE